MNALKLYQEFDLIAAVSWFDSKIIVPEKGDLITKIWVKSGKITAWSGFYQGGPKDTSFDYWILLAKNNLKQQGTIDGNSSSN